MSGSILLPTAYFPPISYFAYIVKYNKLFIEQMETYPKQTYRNRCEIMTSAGRLNLVVPVKKIYGNHTMTRDIGITYREPWHRHHWKSLQTAYHSSPYFNYYADYLKLFFETDEVSLLNHNTVILRRLLRLLKMDRQLSFSYDYEKDPEGVADLRLQFKPGKKSECVAFTAYPQVFSHDTGFMEDLSVLDLIFNLGPEAKNYIEDLAKTL
jgi:hypothetical protein